MVKKAAYIIIFLFMANVVYANGTAPLTAEDLAHKSVQDLQSLQTELKSSIDAEIGDAKCKEDSQCKALAIGANPCGGPESYSAYSVITSDVDRLAELAAQFTLVRKTLHAKTGVMGACVVIPEPTVQCKNQQCISIQKPNTLVF